MDGIGKKTVYLHQLSTVVAVLEIVPVGVLVQVLIATTNKCGVWHKCKWFVWTVLPEHLVAPTALENR